MQLRSNDTHIPQLASGVNSFVRKLTFQKNVQWQTWPRQPGHFLEPANISEKQQAAVYSNEIFVKKGVKHQAYDQTDWETLA